MTLMEAAAAARGWLEAGLEHYKAGESAAAERCFRTAVALRPAEPTGLYLLGLSRLEANDLDEAEQLFGGVLAASPRHAQSWLTLASIRARKGAAAPAAEACRRFLEIEPRSGPGWIALSQASLAARDFAAAVAAGQTATRFCAGNLQAHLAYASALAKLGRGAEAATAYRAALALDENCASARLGLAMALLQQNKPEAALPEADHALTLASEAPLGWFALGVALRGVGDPHAARRALERAVELDPAMAAAHAELGALYDELDDALGSERSWLAAARLDPANKAAAVALSTLYCRAERYDLGRVNAEAALRLDPDLVGAHQNLALIAEYEGRSEAAKRHRDRAFGVCNLFVIAAVRPALHVLVLAGVDHGNSPDRYLLPVQRYSRFVWFVEYANDDQIAALPRYDLVFNAIGDPDGSAAGTPFVERFLERCPTPVLNPPHAIALTARHLAPARLAGVRGLVVPRTERIAAGRFCDLGRWSAPLLLRPAGAHGGAGLERIDNAAELERHVAAEGPDHDYYATAFHDYRSTDGLYRKYRMIFVDRRPYPYHLAISDGWLVHYDRSRTADHLERLEEERRFLDDPERALGAAAYETISAIGRRLDLDFAGVDFSLTASGEVLLFEANATMLVHTERPDGPLAHKNASTGRILQAFWRLVETRAA
ncbi:MAG: tetratricopeptide repeat protein [Roseiarcus sp.]